MIVYLVLLRRLAGLSRDEFLVRWRGEHRALALELPGLQAAYFMPSLDPTDFDGVGMLEFTDEASLQVALDSPTAARLRSHTATFADSSSAIRLVVVNNSESRRRS